MNANDPTEEFLKGYELYNDAIFRYCYFQTSNREVALDLTQDTFTKVWEYIAGGKIVENLRAFLYRVAGNLIIDWRRKKKASSLDAMIEDGYDKEISGRREIEESIDSKEVLAIVGALDEKYRDVLVMRYVEDLSIKEIAAATGASENNISVRLHRALEKARSIGAEKYND